MSLGADWLLVPSLCCPPQAKEFEEPGPDIGHVEEIMMYAQNFGDAWHLQDIYVEVVRAFIRASDSLSAPSSSGSRPLARVGGFVDRLPCGF